MIKRKKKGEDEKEGSVKLREKMRRRFTESEKE